LWGIFVRAYSYLNNTGLSSDFIYQLRYILFFGSVGRYKSAKCVRSFTVTPATRPGTSRFASLHFVPFGLSRIQNAFLFDKCEVFPCRVKPFVVALKLRRTLSLQGVRRSPNAWLARLASHLPAAASGENHISLLSCNRSSKHCHLGSG